VPGGHFGAEKGEVGVPSLNFGRVERRLGVYAIGAD